MFGSLMPRVAWAQYSAPPAPVWNDAYDRSYTYVCNSVAGTRPIHDWYYGVTPTKDGGSISVGYSSATITATCATLRFTPLMVKHSAAGVIEWAHIYPLSDSSRIGNFREVVECQDGSGYVAVGYESISTSTTVVNRQIQVVKVDRFGALLSRQYLSFGSLTTTVPSAVTTPMQPFSIREVFTYDAAGQLVGDGYVIGGMGANTTVNPEYHPYVARLSATMTRIWDKLYTDRVATSALSGAPNGIVRPLYATGTDQRPSATRAAYAPTGAATPGVSPVVGFVYSGLEFFSSGPAAYCPLLGELAPDGTPRWWHHQTAADIPAPQYSASCVSPTVIPNYSGDIEQSPTGQVAVAQVFNRTSCNSLIAGDLYLRRFTPTATTTPPSFTDLFLTTARSREWWPNVAPTPDGGYAVLAAQAPGSVTGSPYDFQLHKVSATGTAEWGSSFANSPHYVGADNEACAFGLALTADGSYLLGGDNTVDLAVPVGTQTNHDDAVLVKLRQPCLNLANGFDVVAANNALPANNWTTARRIRGTVTVKNGGVLTISGPGAFIEFADTRTYQLPTTPKANPLNPTRIVVEPGGKLVIRDGAHLTVLNDAACGTPGAMWDGIVLKGVPTKAQTPAEQPVIELSGCTIEKAHVGVLAGRMNYSASGLPAPALNDGGGLVTATNTLFRNCFNGVNLQTYGRTATAPAANACNSSSFTHCIFRADAVLADPLYITAPTATPANVRLPSQVGLKIFTTQGVQVMGCTFELVGDGTTVPDGTTDVFAVVPTNQRGTGIYASNSTITIQDYVPATGGPVRSTFRRLYNGVLASNTSMAYMTSIKHGLFEGCLGGISLTGVASSLLADNDITIGRATDGYPYGLSLYNSYGYAVRNNRFTAAAVAGTDLGGSNSARGLLVTLSDGATNSRYNVINGNSFHQMASGMYVQRGNSKLALRCNEFTGVLNRADIEVLVGAPDYPMQPARDVLRNPQGTCLGPYNPPASNQFSHTCGTAKEIMISGINITQLQYNHFGGTVTTPNCINAALALTQCQAFFNKPSDCPTQTAFEQATDSDLSALLGTSTFTDPGARAEVIDEMLRRQLATCGGGVNAAVDMLRALNEPGYEEQLLALEVAGNYQAANRTAAPRLPKHRRHAVGADTQARTTPTATYFDEVRELLAPLGSDSAIVVTLKADSTLRKRLWQIANDTTTWGYVAGQATLGRYLGYKFRPWFEGAPEISYDAFRTTAAPAASKSTAVERGATLALYPNPADDVVTLTYTLPHGAATGQIELHDQFGKRCRVVELNASSQAAAFNLRGLLPGLYYYTYSAEGERVMAGTLVKRP